MKESLFSKNKKIQDFLKNCCSGRKTFSRGRMNILGTCPKLGPPPPPGGSTPKMAIFSKSLLDSFSKKFLIFYGFFTKFYLSKVKKIFFS